jgi:hypothetical protein
LRFILSADCGDSQNAGDRNNGESRVHKLSE